MKKELVFILFLFSLSFISALPELSFPDKIQPGETALGVISGNFAKNIVSSDIVFYEGEKQIFMEYSLAFYGGKYYFYAYSSREGNFTIKINNILYKEPELNSITLSQDFQVVKSPEIKENKTIYQILSIKPGFILTTGNTKLSLSNKGNIVLNLTIKFENSTQKINLSSGEFKEIQISPTEEFSILSVGSYKTFEIPVIFARLTNVSTTTEAKNMSIIPSFLKVQLKEGQNQTKQIFFANPDLSEISNFSEATDSSIISFNPNSTISGKNNTFSLEISFSPNTLGSFISLVNFTFLQNNISKILTLPIEVYVFSKDSILPEDNNISSNNTSYRAPSCAELGGNVCSLGVCTGTGTYSIEGYCCIGQCNPTQEASSSSSGWIIGIILVLVLGGIGYFVYQKYKNTKPAKPEDTLKKKAELYEKRVSGNLTRN